MKDKKYHCSASKVHISKAKTWQSKTHIADAYFYTAAIRYAYILTYSADTQGWQGIARIPAPLRSVYGLQLKQLAVQEAALAAALALHHS
jgi:hypothetical protein